MNFLLRDKLYLTAIWVSFFIITVQAMLYDDSWAKTVYVIPVTGTVDPGMAAYIERAISSANTPENDVLLVLELDTFGGRVDSALNIVDLLLDVPKEKTVAYVSNKAISAGALVALACGTLVMKHHTTIGDCAPISYSSEGPQMLGEKFQSPLRAKFRSLARRNGYPEILAESMVTAEMEVYEVVINDEKKYLEKKEFEDLSEDEKKSVTSKRTIISEGQLLTMDDTEAFELGFSQKSVSDIQHLFEFLDLEDSEVIRVEEMWSESLVRMIGSIAPILMLIGLAALYTEIQAPGFGLPGIIGILLLALVFLNQYLVGLAHYTEFLFIALGIVFIGVELFVLPGFGFAGIAGITCIIIGLILSFQGFVLPDPSLPWEKSLFVKNITRVLGSFIGAFLLGLFMIRYILPKFSKPSRGPYLMATLEGFYAGSEQTAKAKLGDTGVALTFLRPSGKAQINEEVFDVVSDGEFIEKETPVVISGIRGNTIIVSVRK
ncbi:MAG: NfeD family protein [Desulfobacterales bacterium]